MSRLAVLRWAIAVTCVAAVIFSGIGLVLAFRDPALIRTDEVIHVARQMGVPVQILMAFGLVGPMLGSAATSTFIFWRRPSDRMALTFSLMLVTLTSFSTRGLTALASYEPAARPVTFALSVIGLSSFIYVFLTFPSGRLGKPARVFWLVATGFIASRPSALDSLIQLRASSDAGLVDQIYIAGFALIFLVFAGLQVFRYRRGSPLERLQIKWVVLPIVGIGAYVAVMLLLPSLFVDLSPTWFGATLIGSIPVSLAFPICIARGVLKYRLYEIDAVINRALVYGSLTAILALGYLALVVLLQSGLSAMTIDSDLAVAASTLAVAAAFRPLRSRVQVFIDQRFYRRKYDAAETLERFSARLRDQVDLDSLKADLTEVIGTTIQPSHLSLWLREATR